MKKTLIISVTLLLIFIACPAFATPVHFDINAGGYGYETSWSITGPSFSAGVSRMASYSTYSYEWDLNPGPYNLYMTDTWGGWPG